MIHRPNLRQTFLLSFAVHSDVTDMIDQRHHLLWKRAQHATHDANRTSLSYVSLSRNCGDPNPVPRRLPLLVTAHARAAGNKARTREGRNAGKSDKAMVLLHNVTPSRADP